MRHFLRIFIGLSIILLAMSVTALSCNKVAGDKSGGGNNSGGGDNSGGGGGGDNTPRYSMCADKGVANCLELVIEDGAKGFAKIVDKTNIIIDAAGLTNAINPLPGREDAWRSYHDAENSTGIVANLFRVNYPGAAEALTFLNLKHVTTNSMALDKPKGSNCDNGSESADNTFATRPTGGHCVHVLFNGQLAFYSFLGTVFNNPYPTTHARGLMRCFGSFYSKDTVSGNPQDISSTTVSSGSEVQKCGIAMVNNGDPFAVPADPLIPADLDDEWVENAGSTKEVELYAVGINIVGKSISGFLPTADNYTFEKFREGVDSETFKKILERNDFKDLRFKVKIVKSTDYVAAGTRCGADSTKCLKVTPTANVTKFKGDTIYFNAGYPTSGTGMTPLTGVAPADRGWADLTADRNSRLAFKLEYPENKAALIFVNRSQVNTNTMGLNAVGACTVGAEDTEEALAEQTGGSLCRGKTASSRSFTNYLGTVFNNTDTAKARATMICGDTIHGPAGGNGFPQNFSDDMVIPNDNKSTSCYVGIVNNAGTVNIDDSWIDGHGGTATEEVELHAIGIDVSGKKISEIATALGSTFTTGNGLAEFDKAWDNAAIKSLLSKYPWRDLKFKFKIVKSTEFTGL